MRYLRTLAAIGLGLVLMASSCDEKGLGDAPLGENVEGPRDVLVNIDQFPNVAVMRDGPTRIYTISSDRPAVVDDHPACE